ncbi:hypothetical protein [Phenylobacterium sp.]|uniref:hypothetical protein n=1 Tax=Phenylobacterium sp. TaxID=1871053 RepID=UPI003BAB54B6
MARPQKRAAEPAPEALEIPAIPAEAWVLAPSPVRLADGAFDPVDSPARALQADLAASFAEHHDDDRRWSARRSLAVITAASLVGWAVLIITARALLS